MSIFFKLIGQFFKVVLVVLILIAGVGVSLMYSAIEFLKTMISCFSFAIEIISGDYHDDEKEETIE